MLVEGSSMRSTARVCDVTLNAVSKLLLDAGKVCEEFHVKTVRNVKSTRVQADEIWSFCGAKQRNVTEKNQAYGDAWTFTGIDADSKLMLTWFVGNRSNESAEIFMEDLADRVEGRIQLTTDGLPAYNHAVGVAFKDGVDYAQLHKKYSTTHNKSPENKYSPGVCIGADKKRMRGKPDMAHVSTSHVERMNLNMRMGMRRFTRLTNAFSKKIESHCAALAVYFVFYNFCRIHKTLKVTPAMAAGLTDELMDMSDIVRLIEQAEEAAPKTRGPYKKRQA
jgi:IS1 family transposase